MNTFGHNLRLTVFGESHGSCIGVVMDGVPAGIPLAVEDFTADIDRRRSGAEGTTPRREGDIPTLVSGVYDGHTTGAPLTILFRNENAHSADYEELRNVPRPGHADFTAFIKSDGFNDPRGGGHFSGRLTLLLVAAGVVAKKIVPKMSFNARLTEVGGIKTVPKDAGISSSNASQTAGNEITDTNNLPPEVMEKLHAAAQEGDSFGGVVECVIENVPAGFGEPFFDSVESLISHAVFSIPGVRGIEFGDGFAATAMKGSEHNDPFGVAADSAGVRDCASKDVGAENRCSKVVPLKNGSGGVNGGITNGAPIVFRVAFKPTSSIAKAQTTVNIDTENQEELKIHGRHDVCFALRTPVIVEAVAAIVLADLSL